MSTVFVSGFTSYIGLNLVKQLLEKNYKVIGSVRSETKGKQYAGVIGNSNFSYVIVPEIAQDGSFDEVFKTHADISVVFHVASPITFTSEDPENEIMIPAMKGTTGILKSIHQYGKNVAKVIITSSYAARTTAAQHFANYQGVVITEDSKDELSYDDAIKGNAIQVYMASKKFAEEAAWEFMDTNKPKFALTTVCPAWVFGPQAYDEIAKDGPVSTLAIIDAVLKLKPTDAVPNNAGVAVDVRDIARGEILAAESKATDGKKLLLSTGKFNEQLILNVVNDNCKLDLPKSEFVDRNSILCPQTDCSKTLSLLGMELIPFEKTVVDTVEQIERVSTVA